MPIKSLHIRLDLSQQCSELAAASYFVDTDFRTQRRHELSWGSIANKREKLYLHPGHLGCRAHVLSDEMNVHFHRADVQCALMLSLVSSSAERASYSLQCFLCKMVFGTHCIDQPCLDLQRSSLKWCPWAQNVISPTGDGYQQLPLKMEISHQYTSM